MRVYLLDSPYTVTRSVWHMNATYKDSLFIRGIHNAKLFLQNENHTNGKSLHSCGERKWKDKTFRLLKKVILLSLQPVFKIIMII